MRRAELSFCLVALTVAGNAFAAWLANGPDGGSVHDVVAAAGRLLIATDDGPYVSADDGVTWLHLGDLPRGSAVRSIAVDPSNPQNLLAAGASLYRSVDGGVHWTAADIAVDRLMFHPTTPADVLGINYLSGGMRRSNDGGASWSAEASSFGAIATTPDPFTTHGYYAVDAYGATQRSTDGGASWQRQGSVTFGDGGGWLRDPGVLALDPTDGTYLVWTANLWSGAQIRRYVPATDSGTSTTAFAGKLASGVIADPSTAGRYWFTASATAEAAGSSLYESVDGARTWSDAGVVDATMLAADASSASVVYGADARGFARSIDAGRTWTSRTRGVPAAVVSAVSVRPDAPQEILAAGAGFGISLSIDGGVTWSDSNTGLTVKSISALARSASEPLVVYAGSDAFFRSADGGRTWHEVEIGSYPANTAVAFRRIEVDRADANRLVALTAGGNVLWSNDGGLNWQRALASTGETGFSFLSRGAAGTQSVYILSSRDFWGPARLYRASEHGAMFELTGTQLVGAVDAYAGDDALLVAFAFDHLSLRWRTLRSGDGGRTWQPRGYLANSFLPLSLPLIRFSPCDANIVYALAGEAFYASADQGATWTPEPLAIGTAATLSAWQNDLDAQCRDGLVTVAAATTNGARVREPEPADRIFADDFER